MSVWITLSPVSIVLASHPLGLDLIPLPQTISSKVETAIGFLFLVRVFLNLDLSSVFVPYIWSIFPLNVFEDKDFILLAPRWTPSAVPDTQLVFSKYWLSELMKTENLAMSDFVFTFFLFGF